MTTPDIYSDRFSVLVSGLGEVMLLLSVATPPDLTKQPPTQPGPTPVGIVRFNKENAKAMVMAARKQLKAYEAQDGTPIKLPKELLDAFKVTEAEW